MSDDGMEPMFGELYEWGTEAELIKKHQAEFFRRMIELAVSHGEDEKDVNWYRVACNLAKKYEPKLRPKVQQGPPIKWGWREVYLLFVDVERLKKFEDLETYAALQKISRKQIWRDFLKPKKSKPRDKDYFDALRMNYKPDSKQVELGAERFDGLLEVTEEDFTQLLTTILQTTMDRK